MEYYWGKEDKKLAKKMRNRASALSWIHENASGSYDSQDKTWSMFLLVSTYILGGTGIIALFPAFLSLIGSNSQIASTISILFGLGIQVLVLVLGILSTVYKAKDLPMKTHNHARASVSYADMFLRIKTALKREADRRQDFSDFFSDLYRFDLQIRGDAGPIPDSAIAAYTAAHGSRALSQDELFGNLVDEDYDSPTLKKSIREITEDEKFQLQRYGRTTSVKRSH